MIVLLGKTASGKDTILNKLIEKYGYKKFTTYTTRPMRKGEIQDKTYHFISDEEFLKKKEEGFFLECNEFDTVDGIWRYGSAKEDYLNAADDTVIILTPSGLSTLRVYIARQKVDIDITSMYIYANNTTIAKRLKKRGDKKEEAERRIKADNDDFHEVFNVVDKIVYNNDGYDIEEVIDSMHNYIQYKKRHERGCK